MPQGTTIYEFGFNLKSELPSSFSGGCGKIKYKLEFIVDRPWAFDEKQTVVLNIIQKVNLNYVFSTLQPFENQITRNIGYIGNGPISLHVFIPRVGYTSGEKIPVQVIVSNNSRIHVDKLKFALNKIIDYHSKSPGIAIKREIQRLLKKEAGGVAKKTEQRYEHVIDVPPTTPSQDSGTSRLIHITYELKIEAKLGGLYKNLIVAVPITVGTIPHSVAGRPQIAIFPALPELPHGLSFHVSALPNGSDTRRLSMASNTSFRSNTSQQNSDGSVRRSHTDLSTSITSNSVSNNSTVSNTMSITSTLISSTSDFQPTAPPMDLTANNTTGSPAHSNTVYLDAPPSYDEVFGSPSTSSSADGSSFSHSSFTNASTPKI